MLTIYCIDFTISEKCKKFLKSHVEDKDDYDGEQWVGAIYSHTHSLNVTENDFINVISNSEMLQVLICFSYKRYESY